jgi:O-antigen/teichoic acid export membrane protein
MGIVFRQSIKNALVIFLGALLGALIIWLSTRYIVDKQQFGFTRNLTQQAVTLSLFLLLGLNNTLAVYIHKYRELAEKRNLLITICFLFPLGAVIIASGLYFQFHTWVIHHYQPKDIPLMEEYYVWLPAYTLLFIYMSILEQFLGSQLKVAVSAFMREVVVRVLNIILLLAFAFRFVNFHTLVVGTVLIYIVPVAAFFLLAWKTGKFGFSLNWRAFPRAELQEIIHFSWYHFLLTISNILLAALDVLLLPFYDHKGLNSVAVYSIAVFLLSFLQMPAKAMIPGSFTVMARAFADDDIPHARDLVRRSSVNVVIATMFMAVVIAANLHNAVSIIKNGYFEIIPLFLILMVGKLFDVATGMNDQVLSITNYYKFNFYLSISLVVALFLFLRILIPIYGVYGAAWSTTIVILIFNTVKYGFVWKKLSIQPFSRHTVSILFMGFAAGAIARILPFILNPVIDTLVRTLVIFIVYTILLFVFKPSQDVASYTSSVIKNKRLF